ncbi:hypothetical protein B7463_g2480, partial [Scytalidium lignicola]
MRCKQQNGLRNGLISAALPFTANSSSGLWRIPEGPAEKIPERQRGKITVTKKKSKLSVAPLLRSDAEAEDKM